MYASPLAGTTRGVRRRRHAALAAAFVLVAGVSCGDNGADEKGATTDPTLDTTGGLTGQAGQGARKEVVVVETSYAIEPKTITIERPGSVIFVAKNESADHDHALEIEGEGLEERSEDIPPGATDRLVVELGRGTYKLYCPIGDHEQKGMVAKVIVKKP